MNLVSETEKNIWPDGEVRALAVCYGILDEALNWVAPNAILREFLGVNTGAAPSVSRLAGVDAMNSMARQAKAQGMAQGWMSLASDDKQPDRVRFVTIELQWQPEPRRYTVCMMDMGVVNTEFPSLYGRKQAYRRMLQEQKLPAFSYNTTLDECRLIDPATGRAEPLEEKMTPSFADKLMQAVHNAVTTGMSFLRRIEDDGAEYFCMGMVNSRGGQVFGVEGVALRMHKPEEAPETWGRRQEDRDSFTGLYNKVSSMEYARSIVDNNDGTQVYLCMVDLDHFKEVNDTYGHEFGDEVIAKAARIFQDAVRGMGIAGRFGGDEFFLVLHKTMTEEQIRDFLRGVRDNLTLAFADASHPVTITCSIGVARYPENGTDFDQLFAKADGGLYIAKRKGRNRYILYKEAIHGEIAPGEDSRVGEAAMAVVDISRALSCTKKAIARLYQTDKEWIPSVLEELCRVYRFESASVYYGEGLPHSMEIGGYDDPIPSMEALQTEEVLSLFDKDGMCRVNLNQFHARFLESYHGQLAAHNITQSVAYLFGDQYANKGAVIFYNSNMKNNDATMPSDEEVHILGMAAAALGDALKRET